MLHTIASPSSRCKLVTFCQSMMWLRGVFTVFQQLFGIGRARAHTRLFGKNRKRYGVWLCCGNSSNERIEIIFWQFGTKDKINELKLTDTLRRFFISSASRHSKILRLEHQPTAFSKLAFCSRPWLSKTRKNRRELFWRSIKRKNRTLFLAEVLLLKWGRKLQQNHLSHFNGLSSSRCPKTRIFQSFLFSKQVVRSDWKANSTAHNCLPKFNLML